MDYLTALVIGFCGFAAGSMATTILWLLLAIKGIAGKKAGKR